MDDVDSMSFNKGSSPQEILESIKLEESQRTKGRLKIFLGMAPGVGKTYAMLEEAQDLKKEQIDVVVGYVEAHERKEIEILLKNLPQIPKKTLLYKGKEFTEMDVDAIISLNPSIVLVDELAHSNVPGLKNEKRWQDVQELLNHGIHVYTTLNVQHIDSLNEIILGITGIVVRETVPDIMIEKAHSIRLVDLTPDELLQRFNEGKVYTEGLSKIAALNYFQKNKLAALREIVLRYVADKVDIDLMRMVTTKEGRIKWQTREKFLVAICESPHSETLIRATRRLATQANAPWIAVYVNTGKTLSKEEDEQLEKTLTLTRGLGSEIIIVNDPDIVEGIKKVAFQRYITQIILGRTPKEKFSLFQGPSLIDRLTTECKNIELHVIRQEKLTTVEQKKSSKWSSYFWQSKLSDYLFISFFVCLLASLSWASLYLLDYRVVEFLFFIGLCILSFFFKRGPIILAAILFGVIWGFFFTPPPAVSFFSLTSDIVLLGLYILTAISFGIFVEIAWRKKELFRKDDEKTSQITEILGCLHSNLEIHDIFTCLEESLPKVVDGMYKFVIKNNNGNLDMDNVSALVGDKERTIAFWAFKNGREAGWSTETLPLSENLYIPLKGPHEIMGLLIYKSPDERMLTKEERNLIYNFCQQFSNYLEKSLAKDI